MTKGEVLEKLKNCVQQQDPAFRKRFLDFGKELDGKVNRPHFRKVGEWVSLCFCVSFFLEEFSCFIKLTCFRFSVRIYSRKEQVHLSAPLNN